MAAERTILVVTTDRADWGHLRSLALAIAADPELELRLLASGSHLAPGGGASLAEIEADGLPVWRRLPLPAGGDDEAAALRTVGEAIVAVGPVLAADRPDLMVLLGDRTEIMAFALAALVLRIPLAHLHGGEITAGAIDESIRHAVTKLATYHFAATEAYAANVVGLGEDPARVFAVGAPGLDGIDELALLDRAALFAEFALDADRPLAVVAFHPVTTEAADSVAAQTDELLAALAASDLQAVLTGANADAHGRLVNARLEAAAAAAPGRFVFRRHLGRRLFFSALSHADLMLGNSSAGIIEAPSFGLPTVNVGDRQEGRVRAAGVRDVPCDRRAIASALDEVRGPAFRASCAGAANPYLPAGKGFVGRHIKEILKSVSLDPAVLKKRLRPSEERHA